jgi:hypothetical protein
MTPELKARVSIDALLFAAGWHVCNMTHADLGGGKQLLLFWAAEDSLG